MNELIVVLIVMLLPGIIAATIADKITVHSKWTAFRYTQYSLLLGITCYAAIQVLVWICVFITYLCSGVTTNLPVLQIWSAALHGGEGLKAIEILLASAASVPLAFFVALIVNGKWITRIAQWMRVSTKYGEENLFTFYLNAKEIDWVYVREPDRGFTYQGRVMSHSENNNMQEIVLTDVTVYNYVDSAELYSVPTIYIARKVGRFTIEAISESILDTVGDEGKKDEQKKASD